jgi:hypothetical protein
MFLVPVRQGLERPRLGLTDTGPEQNWLPRSDIRNLLRLAGFELVAESRVERTML